MIQTTSLSAELILSLIVIAFVIGMAVFYISWFMKKMKEGNGE